MLNLQTLNGIYSNCENEKNANPGKTRSQWVFIRQTYPIHQNDRKLKYCAITERHLSFFALKKIYSGLTEKWSAKNRLFLRKNYIFVIFFKLKGIFQNFSLLLRSRRYYLQNKLLHASVLLFRQPCFLAAILNFTVTVMTVNIFLIFLCHISFPRPF